MTRVPWSWAKGVEVVGEADHGLVAAADQDAKAEAGLLGDGQGVVPMPPLWLTIEIAPRRSESISVSAVAKVAVTGTAVLMMPTQLGPQSAKPASRQSATSERCSSAPSPPGLREPARIGDAVAHARRRAIPDAFEEARGRDRENDEVRRRPAARRRSGRPAGPRPARLSRLTGQTGPGKPNLTSRRTVSPPRLPERSEAPITATDLGSSSPETSRKSCFSPNGMSISEPEVTHGVHGRVRQRHLQPALEQRVQAEARGEGEDDLQRPVLAVERE